MLLCRLVNVAAPETVDERVINMAPPNRFLILENLNLALNAAKSCGVKVVNIGPEDLQAGDKKLVLGLTWTLILKYEIHQFGIDENMILKWVRLRVGDIEVTSWGESFRDGLVFCALIQHHAPGAGLSGGWGGGP